MDRIRSSQPMRTLLAVAMGCVMLLRLFAPSGFMPVPVADSIGIQLCQGFRASATTVTIDHQLPTEKPRCHDGLCGFSLDTLENPATTASLAAGLIWPLTATGVGQPLVAPLVRQFAALRPPPIGPPATR